MELGSRAFELLSIEKLGVKRQSSSFISRFVQYPFIPVTVTTAVRETRRVCRRHTARINILRTKGRTVSNGHRVFVREEHMKSVAFENLPVVSVGTLILLGCCFPWVVHEGAAGCCHFCLSSEIGDCFQELY